jgi:hypothetical protein
MSDGVDPIIEGMRALGKRMDMLVEELHRKVVSSRVKNYTFEDLRAVIDHYSQTYFDNIGLRPTIIPRTWSAAKQLLKVMPVADAKVTIDSAFEDTFFCENIRELWSLVNNLNKYKRVAPPPPPLVTAAPVMPWDDTRERPEAGELDDLNAKLGL